MTAETRTAEVLAEHFLQDEVCRCGDWTASAEESEPWDAHAAHQAAALSAAGCLRDDPPPPAEREALIVGVARGFHDFTGGHPDYPLYDEVSCGGSPEYHCEAGHEHGSRGICWACEPPSAHIVDAVILPLLAARDDREGETAADLIAAERRRQVEEEGYTPEHDREHGPSRLAQAADAYRHGTNQIPHLWPWDAASWKPRDHLSNLIRAGALYLAALGVAGPENSPSASQQPRYLRRWLQEVTEEIDAILAKAAQVFGRDDQEGETVTEEDTHWGCQLLFRDTRRVFITRWNPGYGSGVYEPYTEAQARADVAHAEQYDKRLVTRTETVTTVTTDWSPVTPEDCRSCGHPLTGETGYTGAPAYHEACARKVYGDQFSACVTPDGGDQP